MASTGQSKGNELLVYVDGTAIGYAKDGTLNVNGESIDITSKNSAGWKQTLHAIRGFTIDGSGLIIYDPAYGFSDLFDLIENKTQVELYLKTSESGDAYWYGNAYLKSISEETPNEDASTFSFSFEGDGDLSEASLEIVFDEDFTFSDQNFPVGDWTVAGSPTTAEILSNEAHLAGTTSTGIRTTFDNENLARYKFTVTVSSAPSGSFRLDAFGLTFDDTAGRLSDYFNSTSVHWATGNRTQVGENLSVYSGGAGSEISIDSILMEKE